MSEITTPLEARNEYNDILSDLSFYLDDGEGESMTPEQKDWMRRFADRLDRATADWVRLLGGEP